MASDYLPDNFTQAELLEWNRRHGHVQTGRNGTTPLNTSRFYEQYKQSQTIADATAATRRKEQIDQMLGGIDFKSPAEKDAFRAYLENGGLPETPAPDFGTPAGVISEIVKSDELTKKQNEWTFGEVRGILRDIQERTGLTGDAAMKYLATGFDQAGAELDKFGQSAITGARRTTGANIAAGDLNLDARGLGNTTLSASMAQRENEGLARTEGAINEGVAGMKMQFQQAKGAALANMEMQKAQNINNAYLSEAAFLESVDRPYVGLDQIANLIFGQAYANSNQPKKESAWSALARGVITGGINYMTAGIGGAAGLTPGQPAYTQGSPNNYSYFNNQWGGGQSPWAAGGPSGNVNTGLNNYAGIDNSYAY